MHCLVFKFKVALCSSAFHWRSKVTKSGRATYVTDQTIFLLQKFKILWSTLKSGGTAAS